MVFERTDAEETRERYEPDVIIARSEFRQLRIHQFVGERMELRLWHSKGDGVWTTRGSGLKVRAWEALELRDALEQIATRRKSHWAWD